MRKFFVDGSAVLEEKIVIRDPDDIRHITRVLRLKPGAELSVSDGSLWEYRCEIAEIERDRILLRICDKQKDGTEPALRITLYQGIPKQGKMEEIIQKSVELGVSSIVPVFTARTVVADKGKTDQKRERWQKIAREAGKQCRRGIVPEVTAALTFGEALSRLKSCEERGEAVLMPYENEEGRTLKSALKELRERARSGEVSETARALTGLSLIIGPEGGFSDREAELLQEEAGAVSVTLGRTILRTETAGPAAAAMILYELEMKE